MREDWFNPSKLRWKHLRSCCNNFSQASLHLRLNENLNILIDQQFTMFKSNRRWILDSRLRDSKFCLYWSQWNSVRPRHSTGKRRNDTQLAKSQASLTDVWQWLSVAMLSSPSWPLPPPLLTQPVFKNGEAATNFRMEGFATTCAQCWFHLLLSKQCQHWSSY